MLALQAVPVQLDSDMVPNCTHHFFSYPHPIPHFSLKAIPPFCFINISILIKAFLTKAPSGGPFEFLVKIVLE